MRACECVNCTDRWQLNAQQDAIRAPLRGPSVILTTNVAETSLTVPGVTAVIDAGLHRVASYDPERDLNTLYLQGISMANAVQRAGRRGTRGSGRLHSPVGFGSRNSHD